MQFSLRSLLVVVALLGIIFAETLEIVRLRRQASLAAIKRAELEGTNQILEVENTALRDTIIETFVSP